MSIFKESDMIGNFKWSKKMLNKAKLSRHGGTYSLQKTEATQWNPISKTPVIRAEKLIATNPFNRQFLSAHCMPSSVPGTGTRLRVDYDLWCHKDYCMYHKDTIPQLLNTILCLQPSHTPSSLKNQFLNTNRNLWKSLLEGVMAHTSNPRTREVERRKLSSELLWAI